MSRAAHAQVLRSWVHLILAEQGVADVIWLDSLTPRPAKPYAAVRVLTDVALPARIEERAEDKGATLDIHHLTHRSGTFTVQIYGDGHADLAAYLEGSIRRQDVRDLLELGAPGYFTPALDASVTVRRAPAGIVSLGTETDLVTEDRSIIDFIYDYTRTHTQSVTEWVESATLTGTEVS